MHIAILAPSDKSYIAEFLPKTNQDDLPIGLSGAVFIGSIIRELLKQNHKVTAITNSYAINNDYTIKSFNHKNFTWTVVPSRPKGFRMNGTKLGRIVDFYKREINEMASVIKAISPDIVHAHWSYEFAGAALKSEFPFLVTVHDNPFQILRFTKHPYRLLKLFMSEYFLRKTKYTSTVSPYLLPYLNKRIQKSKIIPNPTPVVYNEEQINTLINKRLKIKEAPKIIMINNGWANLKNGKIGLIAFNKLLAKYPRAELHLYGNGSEIGGPAEKDASLLGVKNTYFHGEVSNQEIFEALNTSHLFIHPSIEESFGVVLIEAMSLGLPTVGGKKSGAVPWVIGNENLLIDIKNANILTNKIQEILEQDEIYSSISLLCYQNVLTRFSAKRVTNEYLNYYREIINLQK